MRVWDTYLIALALSTECFCAAVDVGTQCTRLQLNRRAASAACCFALFQAGMCIAGCFLSQIFPRVLITNGHWTAFALLGCLAAELIVQSFRKMRVKASEEAKPGEPFTVKLLFRTALGISVSAFIAGVALGVMGTAPVLCSCIIGAVCFLLSLFGAFTSRIVPPNVPRRATAVGGLLLFLAALDTLLRSVLH